MEDAVGMKTTSSSRKNAKGNAKKGDADKYTRFLDFSYVSLFLQQQQILA